MDTWTVIHGGCYHVTEVGGPTFCETRAEGCHIKSSGVCGTTRRIHRYFSLERNM